MDLNSIFFLTLFFIFFLIIFKKLNIFVDNTNYSDHKKIGIENFKPIVIGGFYIALVVCIFFPKEFNYIEKFPLNSSGKTNRKLLEEKVNN